MDSRSVGPNRSTVADSKIRHRLRPSFVCPACHQSVRRIIEANLIVALSDCGLHWLCGDCVVALVYQADGWTSAVPTGRTAGETAG